MNITELAQRITERKFHDWSQSVMHDCDFCNQWSLTVKHENGERICASCCDDEYTSKLEVANAALVEALEKAQQVDEELCKLLPPGVEYMDPPDGGDVTPLEGVRRMVADYRQRIAELESRTVTVKPMRPGHITVGGEKIGIYLRDDVDEFMAALTAQGIKVETE
ncbi:hypothetical protein [Klebsiella quasivariicola]|uniref:hypothetical protein n=1 Tax=Klebsiella quasivariicola TaxID=2026240 RepID=UPI001CCCBE5B|nr:hypothetical protein [Klebsiella quasivariicola]MBZ9583455.1 hypothetical protein [Klebsiella quasivariicola]